MTWPLAFEYPAALWLLCLLPVAWLASARSLTGMSTARRRVATVVRSAVLILLVLAAAGAQRVQLRDSICVLYLVDTSDSMDPTRLATIRSYINEAGKHARRDDVSGVLVFGQEALLDTLPVPDLKVKQFLSVPSTNHTDIAQAIRLALAAFPPGSAKKIVLFSDGNENLGNAMEEALIAESNDAVIDVVPMARDLASEVILHKLTTPPRAKRGEPFECEVVAEATRETPVIIELWRNDAFIDSYRVDLSGGKKERIPLPALSLASPGFYTFEARLQVGEGDDTIPENNVGMSFTRVQGEPKALLVSSDVDRARFLHRALTSAHIETRLTTPAAIPLTLGELAAYDSLILDSVNAVSFTAKQMKMVQGAVRELGIGLVMIGGDDSFGLGGYYKTPIEEALPVDTDVKQKKHFPSTAVVIAIDQSGSMSAMEDGKQKIEMANEAACLVTDLLTPRDEIAVLAVDTMSKEVVGLTKVEDPEAIKAKIRTLRGGGGGIYCYTALAKAFDIAKASDGKIRHVILLADGNDSEQQEGCRELVSQMAAERVTVTSVSIGAGIHSDFLRDVAGWGKGRFYIANKMAELPRIYTKETFLVARSIVIEEPFSAQVADPFDEASRGVDWATAPPLLGYIGTTAKGRAHTPLLTHKADPLMAHWQYGLGRSLAFTSDATNRWAARWLGWEQFGKLWAQWIRWTLKPSDPAAFETSVVIERGQGTITVDAVGDNSEYLNFMKSRARLLPPDLEGRTLELEQTAPGRYQATFDAKGTGVYMVNVTQEDSQGNSASQTTGAVVPYPDEYRDVKPDTYLLSRLADTTHGKALDLKDETSPFRRDRKAARTPVGIWWQLLLWAVGLFVLDVAVRRIAIERQQVEAVWAKVVAVRHRARSRGEVQSHATLGRLRGVKETGRASETALAPPPAPAGPTPTEALSETAALQRQLDEAVRRAQPPVAPAAEPAPAPPEAPEAQSGDTMGRLLAAKRRARK